MFGSAKVNVVRSGTEIRDEQTGRKLGNVTDEETVFTREAVFVTAATWSLLRAAIEGIDSKASMEQCRSEITLH